MALRAEYNYNNVLDYIINATKQIKESDEYKNASRRERREADEYLRNLYSTIGEEQNKLSELYRGIEENELAEEAIDRGRKERAERRKSIVGNIQNYIGDFGRSSYEHTIGDVAKIGALGLQTIGAKDTARDLAQWTLERSDDMNEAFGRGAEWSKTGDWKPDSLADAVDAALGTTIDMGVLINSPLNYLTQAGLGKIAGKVGVAVMGKSNKVADAINGISKNFLGLPKTSSILNFAKTYITNPGQAAKATLSYGIGAIPTAASMSLPELYGEQLQLDEHGNVQLPDSVLPTYLLSIPHAMIEHLGVDPRKPFSNSVRKSLKKWFKDWSSELVSRGIGEGLEEFTQDGLSMLNSRMSSNTRDDGSPNTIGTALTDWTGDLYNNYPQLVQSFILGGIGGAIMPEGITDIKSSRELKAQRVNIEKQKKDILALTNGLQITTRDEDRAKLLDNIDKAIEGYDLKISDGLTSIAEKQQLAAEKLNEQEQKKAVSLKEQQDKAMDLINNYVTGMDEQNTAENDSSFFKLPFVDNNNYNYRTIYDNLNNEAMSANKDKIKAFQEQKANKEKQYLDDWNMLPEEEQAKYNNANEYIAERISTDEDITNNVLGLVDNVQRSNPMISILSSQRNRESKLANRQKQKAADKQTKAESREALRQWREFKQQEQENKNRSKIKIAQNDIDNKKSDKATDNFNVNNTGKMSFTDRDSDMQMSQGKGLSIKEESTSEKSKRIKEIAAAQAIRENLVKALNNAATEEERKDLQSAIQEIDNAYSKEELDYFGINRKINANANIDTNKVDKGNIGNTKQQNTKMGFADRPTSNTGISDNRQNVNDIQLGEKFYEQKPEQIEVVEEESEKPSSSEKPNSSINEESSSVDVMKELREKKEYNSDIDYPRGLGLDSGQHAILGVNITEDKGSGYRVEINKLTNANGIPIKGSSIVYSRNVNYVKAVADIIKNHNPNQVLLTKDFDEAVEKRQEEIQKENEAKLYAEQPTTKQETTKGKPRPKLNLKNRDDVIPKLSETKGKQNRIFTDDEFQKRMARLKSAANRIGVNPFADPQIVEDALYCSCYFIESGARKFGDYCKKMVESLGENAEKFREYLAGFYMMAKKDPRLKALNIDKKEFSTEDEVDSFDIDSLFRKEEPKQEIEQKQEEVKKPLERTLDKLKIINENKKHYKEASKEYDYRVKKGDFEVATRSFKEWLEYREKISKLQGLEDSSYSKALEYYNYISGKQDVIKTEQKKQEEQTKESNDNYSLKNARILFETAAKNVNKATNNVQKLECALVDILKGRLDNNWLKNKCVELGIINKEDWATNKNKCQQYFEAAIAYWARRLVAKELNDKKFNASEVLKVMYDNQPLIGSDGGRTDITHSMQQFSTPIYLSNLLVKTLNLKNTDSVYEPTAGNGLLVSSAIPIVANVYLNELDKTRVKNLSYALGAHVTAITNEDALKKVVPGLANVFIANPPFGALSDHNGQDYHYNYRGNDFVIKKIDHAIILKGLETAVKKNNGKAVVIYGGFMRESDFDSIDNKVFQRLLENDYNIVGQFVVGGNLYNRQGTKFPVVVTFIDGKNTENGEEHLRDLRSIPVYDKWNNVETALQNIGEVFRNGRRTAGKENAGTMGQQEQRSSERTEQPVDRQADRNNAEKLGNETNRNTEQQRHSENTRNNDGRNKDMAERPELRGQTEPDTRGAADNERSNNRNGEQRRNEGNNRQRTDEQISRSNDSESDRTDTESRLPGRSDSNSRLEQSRRGDISERNDVKETEEKKVELDENLQSRYNSPSHNKNSNGAVVPKNLQKSIEQALNELEEEKGDLVKYVSDFCGIDAYNVLFREQNDAVALACAQMEKNNGSGIVIADDTGTGKGRCCAAIMAASIKQGRIPVFMTNKSGLFGEMRNDMLGVGLSEVVPFIVNNDSDILEQDGKTVAFKKLGDTVYKKVLKNLREGNLQDFQGKTKKFDCIFVTYSQFKDVNASVDNRLNALVRNSKNIDIILDESHAAAGEAKVGRSGRENDINFTNTLTHVIRLIQDVNSCTYLSATWLKNIKNLPLYNKIFPEGYNRQQLVEAIGRAGLIGQEVFVDMLTKNGMYIRREHSYKGVNFGTTKVTTDANTEIERSDNFGKIITSSQAIVNRIKTELKNIAKNDAERLIGLTGHYVDTGEAVEITRSLILGAKAEAGERSLGQANITSPFSIAHNHLNAFLVAMKIENTANAVVKAIQNGEKPVIGLQNTQEALLKDLTIGTTTHMTFSDSLRRVVDSAGTSTITITEPSSRRRIRIDIPPELVGSDVINQAKNEIVKLVDSEFFKSLPISPIDMLIKRIEEIGTQKLGYPVKVGEITGRETKLQYDETGRSAKVLKRIKTVTEHQKIRTLFNNQTVKNGKNDGYDAIIINTSACNGISLHAGKDFKNQNKRIMFILQPIAEINSMVQLLGRIMRAGQVVLPSYEYVVTSLQSETRIVNNLQRKLKNLSANTTSSKESNKNFVETDVYNHYGDDAAVEWVNSHLDLANSLELLNQDGDIKEPQGDDLLINKIAGKIAFLPQNQQIEFWNFIKETYTNIVEEAKKDGSYDLEPKTYKDSAAKTLSKDRLDENKSKKKAVYVEKVEMKIQGEPLEFSQALYRAENRKGFVDVFDDSFVTGLKRDIRESAENLRNTPKEDGTEYTDEQIERIIKYHEDELDKILKEIKSKYHLGNVYHFNASRRVKNSRTNKYEVIEKTYYGMLRAILYIKNSNNIANENNVVLKLYAPGEKNEATLRLGDVDGRYDYGNIIENSEKIKERWDKEYNNNKEKIKKMTVLTGDLIEGSQFVAGNPEAANFQREDGSFSYGWILDNGDSVVIPEKPIKEYTGNEGIKHIEAPELGIDIYTSNYSGSERDKGLTITKRGLSDDKLNTLKQALGIESINLGSAKYRGKYVLDTRISDEQVNNVIHAFSNYEFFEKKTAEERERALREKINANNENNNNGVDFSISSNRVSKAIGSNKLNAVVNRIAKAVKEKLNLGVVACRNAADLLNKLKEAGSNIKAIPNGAEGCVYKGNVYLVADSIQDGNRVFEVLAHEIAGHVGAEQIYPHFNSLMKELLKLEKSDDSVKAIFDDVRKNYKEKDDIRVAGEVFAKVMEKVWKNEQTFTGKVKNLVNYFVKMVKDFFRKVFKANIPFSSNDMYAIATKILHRTTFNSLMKGEVARRNYDESKAFEKEPVFSNDEEDYIVEAYHSSPFKFNKFEAGHRAYTHPEGIDDLSPVGWFTESKQNKYGKNQYHVKIKMKNPFIIDGEPSSVINAKKMLDKAKSDFTQDNSENNKARVKDIKSWYEDVLRNNEPFNRALYLGKNHKNDYSHAKSYGEALRLYLQEQGYDGVIFKNTTADGGKVDNWYIPFSSDNIVYTPSENENIKFSIPTDQYEFDAYLEREYNKQPKTIVDTVRLSDEETYNKGIAEGKRQAEQERAEAKEKAKTASKLAKLARNREKGLQYLEQQKKINEAIEKAREPKPSTIAQKFKDVESWLALNFADRKQKLAEFQRDIEKATGKTLDDYKNPFRQLDTIDGRIQHKTESFKNKYFQPLYDFLVKNGITYDDFNMFTYAMHADERDKHVWEINPVFKENGKRGSGWDDSKFGTTEKVLSDLYAKYGKEKLMKAGSMFWKMNNAVIDMQEEYGLINKETADSIRKRYKYYTPLKHIADDEVTTKVVERALGRTSKATDQLMFATCAIDTTIRWGERNNAKLAMLNLANLYKSPMAEVNRQKLEPYFNTNTGEVEYRLDRKLPDNTITAIAKGVRYNITFGDEDLYNAFVADTRSDETTSLIIKIARFFTNLIGYVSTIANPDFGAANFLRDQTQSGMENIVYRGLGFAKNALSNAITLPKAMWDYKHGKTTKDTELLKEFMESGGMTGFADILRLDQRAANLETSMKEDIEAEKGVWGKIKKLAKHPLDFAHNSSYSILHLFEAFNDYLETATRFGVYKEKRKTSTALEAAELSKNITINFNRHGKLWNSNMNALYLFSNASIQGTRKSWQLLKAASKSPKGVALISGVMAAGFISEFLNSLWTGYDPDDDKSYYDKLEEYKKDGNIVFFMGGKEYTSIPMSPVMAMPYMVGRNSAAYLLGKKKISQAFVDILSNFYNTLNPLGEDSKPLGTILPTALRPLLDIATNKKWYGAPLYPEQPMRGAKKPDYQLYFEHNTNKYLPVIMKWFSDVTGGDKYNGGWIDISPATVQHLMESYTGGVGKSIRRAVKTVENRVNNEPVTLEDIPVARRFYNETNDYGVSTEYRNNSEIAEKFTKMKSNRDFEFIRSNKNYRKIAQIIKASDKMIERYEKRRMPESEKKKEITKIQKKANAAIRKLQ